MGRRHLIQCWQGSKEDRHKMILPVVSSLLLASMAFGAPGANYGAAAQVSPAKQISSPSIQCRTEYVTLWDTEYQEREEQVCETVYEKQCETRTQRLCQPTTRQECTTNYVEECSTIYKNVCVQKYRTEYGPYTETECTTEYKQDCQYEWQGEGNDKVWAPIDGTFQTTSARTWRRPTPGRSPMRRVMSSQRRAAFPCQRNPVLPLLMRFANRSL